MVVAFSPFCTLMTAPNPLCEAVSESTTGGAALQRSRSAHRTPIRNPGRVPLTGPRSVAPP
ncbi:hypothetical protein GCM10017786_14380 [Amycolatopsis deserti]|uniref:Uncharacterized protein n=1 Tax=Amycolatopsis deserti TaxID=185696 RepID=A0ABQ3IL19_9PSEU|nr:hypothetical protein GCM10017786_14380 [Amycolatopsis deserti]